MPGSCRSGFRSRPSAGAGNRRSNGFDVNSMNAMNPALMSPITASTRAVMSSGRCAEDASREHPCAEHQAPEEKRALVPAPHAGDPVMERQRAVRVHRHVLHRKVVRDERIGEAAERERDEQRLRLRGRAASAAAPGFASGTTPAPATPRAQGKARPDRVRGSFELQGFRASTACAASGACSSRRASPVPRARGTRRRRRAVPAQRHPCLRGRGRAARRCRPPGCSSPYR